LHGTNASLATIKIKIMISFSKQLSFRCGCDLDPFSRASWSAYYDFGAQHRIEINEGLGLGLKPFK
jgi:acyl-CoA thioester hydrolase